MNRPLRVCMAMLATNGGSSVVAQELGLGLTQTADFEVRYCHLRLEQQQLGHYLIDGKKAEHSSELLDVAISQAGAMESCSELLSIYEQWPFDILHIHNLQVFGLPAMLLKQIHHVPYIVTFHGSDVLNPHLFDDNLAVAKQVLQQASGITCVSQYLKNALLKKLEGLAQVDVIHNFLRTSWRDKTCLSQPKAKRFIHVSSMRDVKRPILLLKAFARLQQQIDDAELIVVTTTEGAARVEQLLAQGVHSSKGIQTIDADINPEALAEQYSCATAMVLTSRFEGFALVALEALAYQVPVVATRVGAIPEVMGQDWPYLIDNAEPEALEIAIAQAMETLAFGPSQATKCQMQSILKRFHGPQQIQQYAMLYSKVSAAQR